MSCSNKIFKYLENKYLIDQKFKKAIDESRKNLGIPKKGFLNYSQCEKYTDKSFSLVTPGNKGFIIDKDLLGKMKEEDIRCANYFISIEDSIFRKSFVKYGIPERYFEFIMNYILSEQKDCFEKFGKEMPDSGFGCSFCPMLPTENDKGFPYMEKQNFLNKIALETDDDLVAVIFVYPEAEKNDLQDLIGKNYKTKSGKTLADFMRKVNKNEVKSFRTKRAREKYLRILKLKKQGKNSREISEDIYGTPLRDDEIRQVW